MGLTLMAKPSCSLRQGCLWVSRQEVGLWVRTGTPRPLAVSSHSEQWACLVLPPDANPVCSVAGREGTEIHSHKGHE